MTNIIILAAPNKLIILGANMEPIENQESYNALDLVFIKRRICQLRLQHERNYISESFVRKSNNVYLALWDAIAKHLKSRNIYFISPKPTKISSNMVDGYLQKMEEILQGLINNKSPLPQIIESLGNIAKDFYELTFHIKYTIDPIKYIEERRALCKAYGVSVKDDEQLLF